jgi:hypothetical protein
MASAKRSTTAFGSARRRRAPERVAAFFLLAPALATPGRDRADAVLTTFDAFAAFAVFDGFVIFDAFAAFDAFDVFVGVDTFAGFEAFEAFEGTKASTTLDAITLRVPERFPTFLTRRSVAFFKCALSSAVTS